MASEQDWKEHALELRNALLRARDERDEAIARAEAAERERDASDRKLYEISSEFGRFIRSRVAVAEAIRERDEWRARAEAAEAELAAERDRLVDLAAGLSRRSDCADDCSARYHAAGETAASARCHGKAQTYAVAAELVEALIARLDEPTKGSKRGDA